jgi:hypothetical protein
MTPTSYRGVRLAKMAPQERRERLRLIVGEELTAVSRKHLRGHCPNHGAPCDHGSAWTSRELDGIAYVFWKVGRADNQGAIVGGANDGGAL